MRIAVIEKNRERALTIVDGLRDAGDFDITVMATSPALHAACRSSTRISC